MRVNVYAQELPEEALLVQKEGANGEKFSAVMLPLPSSERLHQPPEHTGDDDDRSAVTFWLPKSEPRRERLALIFERMARLVREAPPEVESPAE